MRVPYPGSRPGLLAIMIASAQSQLRPSIFFTSSLAVTIPTALGSIHWSSAIRITGFASDEQFRDVYRVVGFGRHRAGVRAIWTPAQSPSDVVLRLEDD